MKESKFLFALMAFVLCCLPLTAQEKQDNKGTCKTTYETSTGTKTLEKKENVTKERCDKQREVTKKVDKTTETTFERNESSGKKDD